MPSKAPLTVVIPTLNLLVPASSGLHVSTYLVALFGKYICYAMLALSIDLIWGYAGILSLGHGAFFALGGYAMGMYLMRQIGSRGPTVLSRIRVHRCTPWRVQMTIRLDHRHGRLPIEGSCMELV